MAYSLLLNSILCQIINSWPNRKLLNYSYLEQLKDIAPGIIMAVCMGIGVHFVGSLSLPIILILLVQVVCGALIYVSLSVIFKVEEFEYLIGMIKSYLKDMRKHT